MNLKRVYINGLEIKNTVLSLCIITKQLTANPNAHKMQVFFFPILSDIQALKGVARKFPSINRDPIKLALNSEIGEPVGDFSLCRTYKAWDGQAKHDPVKMFPRATAKIIF